MCAELNMYTGCEPRGQAAAGGCGAGGAMGFSQLCGARPGQLCACAGRPPSSPIWPLVYFHLFRILMPRF